MRLKLKFYLSDSQNKIYDYYFNKYDVQGMIYSTLLDANMADIHNGNGIRFFSFSDVFPVDKLNRDTIYNLIISSPKEDLINTLYDVFLKNNYIYLSNYKFKMLNLEKFNLRLSKEFITGSPVVIYLNNKANKYFSLKNEDSIAFLLRRIKENAIKKFNQFYGEDIQINHLIFDYLKFHKEVSVYLEKGKKKFNIIGTTWYSLKLNRIRRNEEKFYKFIMDTGIGEKNSLGFGFLNPVMQHE